MTVKLKTKRDICHDCNIFHVSCNGEMFKRPEKPNKKSCLYQVRSANNTQSKIQVAAFHSLFMVKRHNGVDPLTAFVEAIAQSSDEVFMDAKLKRPHLIKKWNSN